MVCLVGIVNFWDETEEGNSPFLKDKVLMEDFV